MPPGLLPQHQKISYPHQEVYGTLPVPYLSDAPLVENSTSYHRPMSSQRHSGGATVPNCFLWNTNQAI